MYIKNDSEGEIAMVQYKKMRFFFFFVGIIVIQTFHDASSSRIIRFLEKSRKIGTQQRFYQTLEKKAYQQNKKVGVLNFSKDVSSTFDMSKIKKYLEEKVPQTQAEILVDKVKDWWDLRNASPQEEVAIKEIIKVLRSDTRQYNVWFKHAEKVFEKYKSLSSNIVQKKLNELRTVIAKEIHKKAAVLKNLRNKIKNKAIDNAQVNKIRKLFSNFSKQVRIAIEKIGIKLKGVDQEVVSELILTNEE